MGNIGKYWEIMGKFIISNKWKMNQNNIRKFTNPN